MNSSQPSAPALCPVFFHRHSTDQSQVWNKEFDTPMADLVLYKWRVYHNPTGGRIIRNTSCCWSVFFTFKNTAHPLHKLASGGNHQMVEILGDLLFHMLENVENGAGTYPWRKDGMLHLSMVYLVVQNPGNCAQKILTWGLNRIPKKYQAKFSIFDNNEVILDHRKTWRFPLQFYPKNMCVYIYIFGYINYICIIDIFEL